MMQLVATSILIISITKPVLGGYGSGTGTDPYGFGDVSEKCAPIFIPSYRNVSSAFPQPYGVIMSKEYLTRQTQLLHNSLIVSPITTELNRACLHSTYTPTTPGAGVRTLYGFNRSFKRNLYPIGYPGMYRGDSVLPDGDSAEIIIDSFSNHADFTVRVICGDDGIGTWVVTSSKPALLESESYAVTQHLLALGFDMGHSISMKYSKC